MSRISIKQWFTSPVSKEATTVFFVSAIKECKDNELKTVWNIFQEEFLPMDDKLFYVLTMNEH